MRSNKGFFLLKRQIIFNNGQNSLYLFCYDMLPIPNMLLYLPAVLVSRQVLADIQRTSFFHWIDSRVAYPAKPRYFASIYLISSSITTFLFNSLVVSLFTTFKVYIHSKKNSSIRIEKSKEIKSPIRFLCA